MVGNMTPIIPTGTVTLLFTDIEGSTRLWESHPAIMPKALEEHDRLLREALSEFAGYVFYTGGDSFGAAFASPSEALGAAIAIQVRLRAANWPEGFDELLVRMALHTGEPEVRDGDYFGQPVNRAARLMSAGHGGQILLSVATQELVRDRLPMGVGLVPLGQHQLKDLFRPETIFQVTGPNLPDTFPPLVTLERHRHNLPSQATPFIGRSTDLAAVVDLLRQPSVRLVTLTGPGGIGKTRLSLQSAADLLDGFEDGVFFVELASVTGADQVISAIAGTVGVVEAGDQLLIETLGRALQSKQMLLVVDNFEHVMAAAVKLADLLASTAGLKILTSSREALRLYGEHEYPVPPLSLPTDVGPQTVEIVSEYEAVSLFLQRAKATKPDFEIIQANAPAIAEICIRLEGLPLAIELAAARVRMFDTDTLLARLSDSLKMLTGGSRDLPHRQQTIRNAIEWSYNLLTDDEQVLFRHLGVFRGGRTIEAIEAVCGPGLGIDPVDGVDSLLNKNLLRREDGQAGVARFVMLETIRAFATEQLSASGMADELHGRHAAYFLEMAEQASTQLTGHDQQVWLNRLTSDYENLRSAIEWSLGGSDVQTGLRLVAALGVYWRYQSHLVEGRQWLQSALGLADQAPEAVHGQLLSWAGFMAWGLGEATEGKLLYEEALAIEQKLGNQSAVARILISLGFPSNNPQETSIETTESGLALARQIGDQAQIAHGLNVLGEIYRLQGEYEAAKQVYEEALPITRATGHRLREAMLLGNLSLVAFALGDNDLARKLIREAFDVGLESGNDFMITDGLVFGGAMIGAFGEPERGVRLLGAAAALQTAIGTKTQPTDQFELDKMVAIIRTQIDEESFDRLWNEGRALSLEEAVALYRG